SQGVTVHGVFLGPVDPDMNRGLEIPKAPPAAAAQGIFDGLEKGEEDIFPDPASLPAAQGWRAGIAKVLARAFAALVPPPVACPILSEQHEQELSMSIESFTTTFSVDEAPKQVFDAISNVRGLWSGNIEGGTEKLGDEFTYRSQDIHYSRQRLLEIVPDNKVVWLVLDSYLSFPEHKTEWTGTKVIFEIARKGNKTEVRFTHEGLVPDYQCFDKCSSAWGFYINDSLKSLITTCKGDPNRKER